MPLYEITLTGTYFGQETINRWSYVGSGAAIGIKPAFGLIREFGAIPVSGVYPTGSILDGLASLCSNQWTWQQVTCLNVYDPTDFYQVPFSVAYGGGSGGDALSPTAAYGWRTNQVRRDIARATKRVPGVTEINNVTGGIVGAAALTAAQTVADRMSATLSDTEGGSSLAFVPAVVKKQRYNPETGLPDAHGTAYRYIPVSDGGETAQLAQTALGVVWQPYTQVRTQVSRQYGHGR